MTHNTMDYAQFTTSQGHTEAFLHKAWICQRFDGHTAPCTLLTGNRRPDASRALARPHTAADAPR